MSQPKVELFFCQHTAENAPEISQAILDAGVGKTADGRAGSDFLLVEIAYDDFDLATSARRAIGNEQVDYQRAAAGNIQLEPPTAHTLYGRVITALVKNGREVRPLVMDVGRTTDTAEALHRVVQVFDDKVVKADWADSQGDAGTYIGRRADRVASSFEYREQVQADAIADTVDSLNLSKIPNRIVAGIAGSNHYLLHRKLEQNGIRTKGRFVHPPENDMEIILATRQRLGKTTDPTTQLTMGIADWLSFSPPIANVLHPVKIWRTLAKLGLRHTQLQRISRSYFDGTDRAREVFSLPYSVGQALRAEVMAHASKDSNSYNSIAK